MHLIDTHAHVYDHQFRADLDEMIMRAKDAGVGKILMPNVDSASLSDMHAVATRFPQFCLPMLGLHPCSVNESYLQELKLVEQNLFSGKENYVAVGEIGLDFYWDKTFIPQQKEALTQQVKWAKELRLPVVLHSRDSFHDVIELLKPLKDVNLKGVFHCFTGTVEEAEQAIALEFFLGIGGVVTFKNSGLDKTIEKIDLKHLILETDAPYLAPAPHRGKRNESSYVKLVAEKIAQVKNLPFDEVSRITTENAKKLFNLE